MTRARHILHVLLLGLTIVGVATGEPLFTAMYVFGDSASDPGNNNDFVDTTAKANFPPYGIDFENGSTGRFCNGKILVDFLAQTLGLSILPSYKDTIDATDDNFLSGVNYASAGAGILPESGRALGRVTPFSQQINNFGNTVDQLSNRMQDNELSEYLAKAVAFVEIGTNDYLNNYIQPMFYASSRVYSPQQFADLLMQRYAGNILNLRSLGLRKFFLTNIPPVGCSPIVRTIIGGAPGQCQSTSNNLVQTFNKELKSLVDQLNSDYPDSTFSYGDSYQLFSNLRENANALGFLVKDESCCKTGSLRGGKVLCSPESKPCENRGEYLFWDEAHVTEAANGVLVAEIYNNSAYSFPLTIQQMANI
ncbi:GDSL esterase/lipase At1g71691-like [Andrographis paniculata]|uniref:GDSL esterase/lipase At1g71691-like n=1 Tax=Andrographis paniculata TaxID=175694 RepID=UPI0021E86B55|nr:GDSL esterase/lipase At1g71691-like [Andrographis paniculata]